MLPITILNFDAAADHPIDLGANPGSSLRGALYEALRVMYDTGAPARSRDDQSNPVAWLLHMEDEATSGGKDQPRPLAIRPPLGRITERFSFSIAFYGYAHLHMQTVLSAVDAMQQIGIGRGGQGHGGQRRNRFRLMGVQAVDVLTGQAIPVLDAEGQQVGSLPAAPSEAVYKGLAAALRPDQLVVEFITPTRIIRNGQLSHQPHFRHWFQRLLERIRHLSELYTEKPIWLPFGELLAAADQVTLTHDETQWREAWSGSRRDGGMKPTSGFVGMAHYSGDLSALLPFVLLGQATQVGKNTIKGCGWYRLHYQWQ